MSNSHLLACMLAVPLVAGAFLPVSQAQASAPMPSCKAGAPPALRVGCPSLSQQQFGIQPALQQIEKYKEAGQANDLIVLGVRRNWG